MSYFLFDKSRLARETLEGAALWVLLRVVANTGNAFYQALDLGFKQAPINAGSTSNHAVPVPLVRLH